MKKICHITSAHTRYDERIFLRECVSLASNDYEVYQVVCDGMDDEIKDGVNIISTKYVAKNRIDRMICATKKVYHKAVKLDADIYHLHDPELLPLAKKLNKKGKCVIYDSHEFYYYQILLKEYIPAGIRKFIAKWYQRYEKIALRYVEAVVVPCTINGKNYFENIAKKVVFIDNRPRKDLYKAVAYNEKQGPVKCCHVGSIARERGIKEMIQASYEAGTPLLLGGEFDKTLYSQLETEVSMELLDYKGKLSPDEVQKIYDESHIGLSLIHNVGQYGMIDNLPTKVYECMMTGLPVVLSRLPYTEKFIQKYPIGILVNPEDVEEIKNAIVYLKEHPEEAKRMGEVGILATMKELCWEKEAQKLIALYCDVLS